MSEERAKPSSDKTLLYVGVISAVLGVLMLPLSLYISGVREDQEQANRYGLPDDLSVWASDYDYFDGAAFPGDSLLLPVADVSTPFAYRPVPASEQPIGRPEWLAEPLETWEEVAQSGWFMLVEEEGNYEKRVRESVCDYYSSRGMLRGTGPCSFQTPAAKMTFRIADDPALVGQYLGLAVRTGEKVTLVTWRVSDPKPPEVTPWLGTAVNVSTIATFLLMGIGGTILYRLARRAV